MTENNRTCAVCGEIEGRDATEYELQFRITPVRFIKKYEDNGKWAGKYICTRCILRNRARIRRTKDVHAMPQKLEECRTKHGIKLRIVRGQPACIKDSEVVHQGIGCSGCRLF